MNQLILAISLRGVIFLSKGFHYSYAWSYAQFLILFHPSANVFVFKDFNIHHKDWPTYSGGTDKPGELCHNLSVSDYLTHMVNFPTRIPVTLTVRLFWIYVFLLMQVFVLQWLSHQREILIMSQFPLAFHRTQNGMPHVIAKFMTIVVLIETVFVII